MVEPKPVHLQRGYGEQFQDESVVAAYHHRPDYPTETVDILHSLVVDGFDAVLDAGCGTGDLARPLAPLVGRVDAVDLSLPMIEKGRRLPGGNRDNLRWIHGAMEDVPLSPPYGLVAAGESLHWMEWSVVLPRFREVLAPGGFVAIVGRRDRAGAFWDAILPVIQRFSTNRDFQPYDIIDELTSRGLFRVVGRSETPRSKVAQPVEDYIESLHSRNGLSRDRMGDRASVFDHAIAEIARAHAASGIIEIEVSASVVWGVPLSLSSG